MSVYVLGNCLVTYNLMLSALAYIGHNIDPEKGNFFWLLYDSMCYFIVLWSSLLFYNVENSKNK
jgi:hypothetical protein